jgi:tetratricopeptide (TPR) repeat protein
VCVLTFNTSADGHEEYYFDRGSAKYFLGRKKEALIDFNKAISINPKTAYSYLNRGSVKKDLGRKKEALIDYNKAISINPDFTLAYANRGLIKLALGDKKGAIDDLNISAKLSRKQNNTELRNAVMNMLEKLK